MNRLILLVCTWTLSIVIVGCAKNNPGTYAQPEVEAQVVKSLKLTEIMLASDPAGGYSGTGKTADGESFKLKIRQDPALKRLSWKADGDRGTIEEGKFEFE